MSTTSQRIIGALLQLEQFLPAQSGTEEAVNVITGARVSALPDNDVEDHQMVCLTFPGGEPVEVNGGLYLQLQVIESVRYELDAPDGSGPVSRRVEDLLEHLHRKHDL